MRRALAALAALAVAGCVLVCAWARPPGDDASRSARVDAMYAGYKKTFGDVPDLTAVELQALLAADRAVVVDVREPAERAVSMIPGALTPEELAARRDTLGDKVVVAYCTIGYRSGQWAKEQRAAGLPVTNLAGSILAWTHAGGELVHDGQPTHDVHVYGSTWDLARSDYHAVW